MWGRIRASPPSSDPLLHTHPCPGSGRLRIGNVDTSPRAIFWPMQTERQGSVAGRAGRKLPLGHGDRWCMHLRHSYHVLLACADVLPASSHTRGYGVFNLVCTMHAATGVSDKSDSGLRCWLATTSESILQVLLHWGASFLRQSWVVSTLPARTELTTSRANLEDPRAVAGCHAKAPYGLDLAAEGSS
jgi:hypothetical protein